MTETQFAMAPKWIMNENINVFVKAHPDVDQLELMSLPFKALLSSLR